MYISLVHSAGKPLVLTVWAPCSVLGAHTQYFVRDSITKMFRGPYSPEEIVYIDKMPLVAQIHPRLDKRLLKLGITSIGSSLGITRRGLQAIASCRAVCSDTTPFSDHTVTRAIARDGIPPWPLKHAPLLTVVSAGVEVS